MKKKIWLIPVGAIFIIVALWFTGIIPMQIAKISGTNYVNKHFPEMQMECVDVEYADVFGDYLIAFKDKGGNTYSCVIGPYLFPSSLGQGLFEIQEYYAENYRLNSNTSNATDTTPAITSIDQIYDKFGHIEYTCDLSVFPTDDIRNWFGEIILVEDGKLLVSPGHDDGKLEYGEVVWLVCDYAFAYSVGQVVTYTFRDVKAPDNEGEPLNIIALTVYME